MEELERFLKSAEEREKLLSEELRAARDGYTFREFFCLGPSPPSSLVLPMRVGGAGVGVGTLRVGGDSLK